MRKVDPVKKHKHSTQRLPTLPFLALWTMGHAAIWPFANLFIETSTFNDMPELLQVLFVFCVIGTLSAIWQSALMRGVFRLRVRNWIPLTILAWMVGAVLAHWYTGFPGGIVSPQVPFAIAYAVPALLQAWLLRHTLRGSWLWASAGIISALVFLLPITEMSYGSIVLALFLGSAGWGLLSGSTLVWLVRGSQRNAILPPRNSAAPQRGAWAVWKEGLRTNHDPGRRKRTRTK